MANKKNSSGKSKKKNSGNVEGNPALLFVLLVICVAVIVFLYFYIRDDKNADNDDTNTGHTDSDSSYSETKESIKDNIVSDTENKADTSKISNDTDNSGKTDIIEETQIPEYTVENETEVIKTDHGDASMEYPVISSDDTDTDIDTETVNALIREFIDGKLREEQLENGMFDTDASYRYEITKAETKLLSKDFMSVLVTGEYYVTDTAHPTMFAYTLNCDIKEYAILSSAELINDFSKIKEKFLDGEFTLVYGDKDLMNETNYEDMILEYRTEYGIYPDIYFTEDSLGMVIDLVYLLGGYTIFEIPYSEIADCVNIPLK